MGRFQIFIYSNDLGYLILVPLLWWLLNLRSWYLIGRELFSKGKLRTPVIRLLWSLYCHNRLLHRHFLEATEPATLDSQGNLPFVVWGWWGARLSYAMEFFPSVIFWNVMRSWHVLQITYFCTYWRIFKKLNFAWVIYSLVTLNFQLVSLRSEGSGRVSSFPQLSSGSFLRVLFTGTVGVHWRMLMFGTWTGQMERTVHSFLLCTVCLSSLFVLNSCRIQSLGIHGFGATRRQSSLLSGHFSFREKFACFLKEMVVSWAFSRHYVAGMTFRRFRCES